MSHPAHSPHSSRRLHWLVGFAINIVIGVLFAYFAQWLPASEGAKRILTRIWGPVVTQYYPATGRDQVTVMLIDDLDLRQYDEAWPVSLGFHQRRLQQLLKYGPKAVFFDIVFLDDRRDADLDGFIDAACRARQQGVPVFVGSFANAGLSPSRIEAEMLKRRVDVNGRSQPCIEAAYLNLKIDGFDQSVWEYDVGLPESAPGAAAGHGGEHGGGHGHHAGGPRYPSPAARLYAVDHHLDEEVLAEPMALVWGMRSDPFNLSWMRNEERDVGAGELCAGAWSMARVLPFGKMGPPLCPYQRTLPLRTLSLASGLDADDLRKAIGGKYIVYGTHLQSAADVITSPYHGRIAGAYLHAMALDNLLSFEGEPRRAGEFGEPGSGAVTGFTLFAVLVICGFIAARERLAHARARRKGQGGPTAPPLHEELVLQATAWTRLKRVLRAIARLLWTRLGAAILFALAAGAVVMLLIVVSYHWLHLGPMVWVEYALFPLGAHFLHIGEKIEEALGWIIAQWQGGGEEAEHAGAA